MAAADDAQLELVERTSGEAVELRPVGELDLSTIGVLRERLDRLHAEKAAVILDLGGLTFMDSNGVHMLLSAQHDAEREGWDISFRRATGAVERVLAITGVDQVLRFRD
jgi:anti-anti-sigma factor